MVILKSKFIHSSFLYQCTIWARWKLSILFPPSYHLFTNSSARHFDYLFYVDLEASMADPNAQNALSNLKEFATFLRVLGSYPTDVCEAWILKYLLQTMCLWVTNSSFGGQCLTLEENHFFLFARKRSTWPFCRSTIHFYPNSSLGGVFFSNQALMLIIDKRAIRWSMLSILVLLN